MLTMSLLQLFVCLLCCCSQLMSWILSILILYHCFLSGFLFSMILLGLYSILYILSVLTIVSVSIRYTLSFTTSGIWLSKSFIVSNPCLHCSMVVRESACLLVVYFLRPSMITLAASKPGWESNFPSSSMVVHECTGISASKW